jgi:hypothetical protein
MARPTIEQRDKNRGDTERFFFPEGGFPHGIQLIFKKYDYKNLVLGAQGVRSKSQFSSAEETGILAVELPMPSTLTDATGLQVNGFERTFLESFIADTLAPAFGGSVGDIAKDLFGLGEGAMKGGIDALFGEAKTDAQKSAASQGSKIASFMAKNIVGNVAPGIGKALAAARGTAINPQATLSFEGVNLRSFQLDWTLYPESKEEAAAIKQIIRSIKRNILPKIQSIDGGVIEGGLGAGTIGGNALSRAFLEYPATVSINLLGIDESHFLRFKPCMVDSFNVDYGASGEIVIAEGGVPQGIKLVMGFKELEIQTAEDYADAGMPTGMTDYQSGYDTSGMV